MRYREILLNSIVRYRLSPGLGLYASGGFGWFRRSVDFNTASSTTLLPSGASTLDRVASNSGVFDGGAGLITAFCMLVESCCTPKAVSIRAPL
jgi:hypothetical protein